jgi:hypothetical protein
MNKVIWKAIPSIPGYEMSNQGKVRQAANTLHLKNGRTLKTAIKKIKVFLLSDGQMYFKVGRARKKVSTIFKKLFRPHEVFKLPVRATSSRVFKYDGKKLINVYPDVKTAAKKSNIAYGTIVGCLNGYTKTAKGFRWKYENELLTNNKKK